MLSRSSKWIAYTVLIGLIPVICRALVWAVASDRGASVLNATDFILFGLILHVSNINQLERLSQRNQGWASLHNAVSIMFIITYAVLFTCRIFGDFELVAIDDVLVRQIAIALSVVSFLLSLSIYYRSAKEGASCSH